jgi:small conductance mechanosensitive channel
VVTLQSAFSVLARYASEFIRIIAIAAASYLAYRLSRAAINRSARLIRRDPTLTFDQLSQRARTLTGALLSLAKFSFLFVALVMILRKMRVDPTPLLAGAGIAGLAIGFGAQNLVRDIISGFFILFENQYSIGDTVRVGDHQGKVEQISLRSTELLDADGGLHIIPNSEVRTVINLSKEWGRALVDLCLPFGADLERALSVLREECANLGDDFSLRQHMLEKPEVLGIEGFVANGPLVRIAVRTHAQKQAEIARELRRRLKNRLAEEGIEIKPTA